MWGCAYESESAVWPSSSARLELRIIEIDPTMTEEDLTDRVTEPFGL